MSDERGTSEAKPDAISVADALLAEADSLTDSGVIDLADPDDRALLRNAYFTVAQRCAQKTSEGGTNMRATGEKPDSVGRVGGMAEDRPGEQHHEGGAVGEGPSREEVASAAFAEKADPPPGRHEARTAVARPEAGELWAAAKALRLALKPRLDGNKVVGYVARSTISPRSVERIDRALEAASPPEPRLPDDAPPMGWESACRAAWEAEDMLRAKIRDMAKQFDAIYDAAADLRVHARGAPLLDTKILSIYALAERQVSSAHFYDAPPKARTPEAPRDVHLRDVCIALIRCWDISPDTAGDGLEASFYDNLAELRALVMPDTARTTSAPPVGVTPDMLRRSVTQAREEAYRDGYNDGFAAGKADGS